MLVSKINNFQNINKYIVNYFLILSVLSDNWIQLVLVRKYMKPINLKIIIVFEISELLFGSCAKLGIQSWATTQGSWIPLWQCYKLLFWT